MSSEVNIHLIHPQPGDLVVDSSDMMIDGKSDDGLVIATAFDEDGTFRLSVLWVNDEEAYIEDNCLLRWVKIRRRASQ